MAISEKFHILSFATAAPTKRPDSEKAREFVKETYQKAGGRPTPELKRVYGEYLKHQQNKAPTRKD